MTGEVIDFRSRRPVTTDRTGLSHMQRKTTLVLDFLLNELRHDKLRPDKVLVLIGTVDDFVDAGQEPETTWRYLQLEFSEKELRAAMEQIYGDIRKQRK